VTIQGSVRVDVALAFMFGLVAMSFSYNSNFAGGILLFFAVAMASSTGSSRVCDP